MRDPRRNETGFALVLALLALLLLTFLGLTLATTTSTELQIANNYRWSQQALYNAESGLELAKRYMQEYTAWQIFVPAPRATADMGTKPAWTSRLGPAGEENRSFENYLCDTSAVGYGTVLDIPTFTYAFQNVSTFFGQPVSGSFTVWARRKIDVAATGEVADSVQNDRLILTVEGTAPYAYTAADVAAYSSAFRRRAVRVLEVEVRKVDPSECENSFQGQAGMGALGSNYDACSAVKAEGVPGAASEVVPNN